MEADGKVPGEGARTSGLAVVAAWRFSGAPAPRPSPPRSQGRPSPSAGPSRGAPEGDSQVDGHLHHQHRTGDPQPKAAEDGDHLAGTGRQPRLSSAGSGRGGRAGAPKATGATTKGPCKGSTEPGRTARRLPGGPEPFQVWREKLPKLTGSSPCSPECRHCTVPSRENCCGGGVKGRAQEVSLRRLLLLSEPLEGCSRPSPEAPLTASPA